MLHTFCSGRGSNQDLLCGSQTLYRVAIKAGLYRKAVQVCIIPNITTGTTISLRVALWVVMETMHFHITREMYSGGRAIIKVAPMKNGPGFKVVQIESRV